MKILHTQIKPISIFRDPDDGGVATAEPGAAERTVGSAFSNVLRETRADTTNVILTPSARDAEDPTKKKEEPKKEPAKDEKKPEKKEREKKGAQLPDSVLDSDPDKKKEVVKEEKKPTDDERQKAEAEFEGKLSKEAKVGWDQVKGERDKFRQENEKLKAELETVKKDVVPPDQREKFAKLEKEHAELLQTVEKIALERSPKFQEKYVKGRASLIDQAAAKVKQGDGDVEAFKAAMQATGRAKYDALEAVLEEMPGFLKTQITGIVTQIETLDEEKEQAIGRTGDTLKEWDAEETARAREEGQKQMAAKSARFGEIVPVLAKDFILLRPTEDDGSEGFQNWDKQRKGILERANKMLFESTNFDDFATAALAAEQAPILQQMFLEERAARLALQEELEELESGGPSARNGGGSGAPTNDGKTFADRVTGQMANG